MSYFNITENEFSDNFFGSYYCEKHHTNEPLPEIEGFKKFHDNCLYRQGRLKVNFDGKETELYCHEGYRSDLNCYKYTFVV